MNKFILITAFFLTSCATQPKYLVGECPKITLPPEPNYCVYHLKKGDPASKVWKCYVMTVYQQAGYIKQMKIKIGEQ